MPKKIEDTRPDVIYCACGCGEIVPRHKYPSQQRRYLNFHQHRGEHNGNFKGGDVTLVCGICGKQFTVPYAQKDIRKTCGDDECYRKWQGLTTAKRVAARGGKKIAVQCAHCGRTIYKYPSQIKERTYCNRYCLAAGNPKKAETNGNWHGGKWKFIRDQASIRDEHKCVICGFDYQVHIHHITPLSEGGTNEFSNLITLCPNHHAMAHGGVIDLEPYRNFDWHPQSTIDPTPHANRSHTRSEAERHRRRDQ